VQNFLLAAQLITDVTVTPDSLLDYSGAADSAASAWENAVRWFPFLEDGSDVARTYDPPEERLLKLGAGLMTCTSVTVGGTTYTLNQNYWLRPTNALIKGQVYTEIEFFRTLYLPNIRNTIIVTGKWGRTATVPADVKQALLCKAAALLMPQVLAKISGGGVSEARLEGAITEKYSISDLENMRPAWDKAYNQCVSRWMRKVIV